MTAESDTPRTDKHVEDLQTDPEVSGCNRTIDFARQLERELAQSQALIAKAYGLHDRNLELAEENRALRIKLKEITP